MLDLILALQGLPAARLLPSPNGRGSLLSVFSRYIPLVKSDEFDVRPVTCLVEEVINNATNLENGLKISSSLRPLLVHDQFSNKLCFHLARVALSTRLNIENMWVMRWQRARHSKKKRGQPRTGAVLLGSGSWPTELCATYDTCSFACANWSCPLAESPFQDML